MTMDTKMKAKWVNALRSGKYQQTKDFLRTDDGFCCLGVLCDISKDGYWKPDRDCQKYVVGVVAKRSLLPSAIMSKYAIDGSHTGRLVSMNDDGAPFTKIADYIEENL